MRLFLAGARSDWRGDSGGGPVAERILQAPTAIDGGEMRWLIPQTETVFDGAGIAYQFIVGDNGVATALDEIHISGPSRFPKQP